MVLDRFLGGGSRADHDDEAGDIAGNKRNAEFTDFRIGEVAVIVRALIRGLGLDIFAGLDHLSGDGGADAGLEDELVRGSRSIMAFTSARASCSSPVVVTFLPI